MANTKSEQEIREWLLTNLSQMLGCKPADIDVREDLLSYGLSSMAAVGLSGELEDWLGRKLDPALLFECRTVESLTRRLVQGS